MIVISGVGWVTPAAPMAIAALWFSDFGPFSLGWCYFVDWRQEVLMIRLGMVLAAVVLMSATDRVAHARMAIQTFAVLAGAGAHDVFPAADGTVWFTAQV